MVNERWSHLTERRRMLPPREIILCGLSGLAFACKGVGGLGALKGHNISLWACVHLPHTSQIFLLSFPILDRIKFVHYNEVVTSTELIAFYLVFSFLCVTVGIDGTNFRHELLFGCESPSDLQPSSHLSTNNFLLNFQLIKKNLWPKEQDLCLRMCSACCSKRPKTLLTIIHA